MARIVSIFILILPFIQNKMSAQNPTWRAFVSYFNANNVLQRSPNIPNCSFIANGQMRVVTPNVPPNTPAFYTNFDYNGNIPVTDNFSVEVRLRNSQGTGGLNAYDTVIEMLEGGGKSTYCRLMGEAWAQNFTHLSVQNTEVGQNLPFLVQNLSTWRTFKIRCQNRNITFSMDNTVFYTGTYTTPICQIEGLKFLFKGQGGVDWVRVTNEDNNEVVYNEDFNNCNNLQLPQLARTPSVSVAVNAPCEGDSLKMSTAIRAVAYEWRGPNGFSSTLPNPTIPKTNRSFDGTLFSLQARLNGCQTVDTSFRVRVRSSPVVNLGNDTFSCSPNEPFILDAQNSGSTYIWQNGLTNRYFNVIRSGNYAVTVTNTEKCSASSSVRVDVAPTPIAPNAGVVPAKCYNICNADAFTNPTGGFGAPYAIYWTGGETRNRVIGLCQGKTLTLSITDRRGCVTETPVNIPRLVRVDALALPDTAAYNGFAISCPDAQDGKAIAKGSGGAGNFSYRWLTQPEQTTRTAENLKADTIYRVIVSDKNGCKDTAAIQLKAPPPIEAAFDLRNIRCGGEKNGAIRFLSATGGTGAFDLIFNEKKYTARNAYTFDKLASGTYNLTLIDSNKCKMEQKITLQEPPKLKIISTPDTVVGYGDEFKIYAGADTPSVAASVLWFSASDSARKLCTDCFEISETAIKQQRFKVRVVDTFGCSAERMITVSVDRRKQVFVPNIFSPNADGVNDVLEMTAGRGVREVKSFRIFNRWGALVHQRENFQKDDKSHGWNGQTQNGEAQANDVFTWFMTVEFEDNETVMFQGDITVMR